MIPNKTLFVFILLLSAVTGSFGKTVDESQARVVALGFLQAKGIAVYNTAGLTTAYTATGNIEGKAVNSYYVFNVTGGHAFVMVSADDRIRPILAYSNESSFEINGISPSAKNWIEGYKNKVTAAIKYNVPAKSATAATWKDLLAGAPAMKNERTANVAPLLGTLTWNQSPYYNEDCPGYGPYQAPTGCVATSMAQVMKYWNWPPVGTGSLAYNCTSYSPAPIPLSADFGNTAYDWTAMPDNLSSFIPSVAELMLHAGISVEMDYDTSGSGAEVIELQSYRKTQCTEYALKTYFHYKRSLTGIPRNGLFYIGDSTGYIDSVSEPSWTTMLHNELNAGRPVIYCGYYGTVEGHAWVCDGWESSDLFHFNWGWGGTGPDGYYTVDDLAPPVMGIGGTGSTNFNTDQAAIIGIEPDSFPNTPGNLELAAHLQCATSTPMSYGTPFSITTAINNTGTTTFTGDFCAQVFDTLNNLTGTIQTYTGESISAGSITDYTFGPSVLYAMIPMDYYHIQVMYRPTGGNTWTPVANSGVMINYTTADVTNDTDIALYANINITTPLPVISGAAMNINTRLQDQGTASFNGTIQAVMINIASGASYPVQALPAQTIGANGYLGVSFSNASFTAPNGVYALVIQHQYGGAGNFYTTSSDYYENPVLVNVGANTSIVPTAAVGHDVYVFPNPAKDMITILPNGVNITGVKIYDMLGHTIQKQIQPNGKSAITVPVSDLAAGEYLIRMTTADAGVVDKKIVIK
jgi:hypothetical protein